MLPPELKDIILDYYWSHRMYLIRKKVMRELRMSRYFVQVMSFYELYHHINVSITFPHPDGS